MHDIREGMPVFSLADGLDGEELGKKGARVGTVDHLDGDSWIKLARKDDPQGIHHWIPVDWVKEISDGEVHLALGIDAVTRSWKAEKPAEQEEAPPPPA